jgi:ribosomal protein RSM22 (predicted rRNA methylase)
MTVTIPPALKSQADALLDGYPRKELAARAARISDHYRAAGASAPVITNPADVTAYLFSRLPGTYAAVSAVLSQTLARNPALNPASLLDVGAGPGTAAWAAFEAWPNIKTAALVDSNTHFLKAAKDLAQASPSPGLANASVIHDNIAAPAKAWPEADLVIASFALAELPPDDQTRAILRLWKLTRGTLILIEPGTTPGFERIRTARSLLLAQSAHILAPCPHHEPCPIISPDWCHFVQRVSRSRDHMLAKGAYVPFEDEKFSYLALSRTPAPAADPYVRILTYPKHSKHDLRLKVCTPTAIQDLSVPTRNKPWYAAARRLDWGDPLTLDTQPKKP